MSYWSLLEESRRRLTAGDFLESERFYYEAREDHRASRLRAPIMEKGVEPLVRGMRRLIRREPEDRVGPAFPTAADRLLKDLQDVAALHLGDARRRALDGWEEIDLDGSSRLGVALRMQRRSELFALSVDEHWAVLRAYLHGCARHGMEIQSEYFDPEMRLGEAECIWLADYTREQLARRPQLLAPTADWLGRALEALAHWEDHPHQGEALALRCELLLFDPIGAPAALREGVAALSATHAPRDAATLLRRVGGLRCNEERLASPVASLDSLRALRPLASRFGVSWPPPELEALLAQRSPDPEIPILAALAWEGGPGDRVVLIQQEGPAPVDVLLLRPIDESEAGDDPFASPMTEALARVEEWLSPGAPVLCGPTPPSWLLSLLGERPYISLEELEEVLPRSRSASAPAAAAASHPLFEDREDPLCEPWRPLVAHARELSPRLLALTAMPALTAEWGLRNLDSMGRVGIGLARRLSHALRALAVPADVAAPTLDALPGAAMLEWPRLVDRAWPGEMVPNIQIEMPEGDLLIQGRPSAGELAGCALASVPCVLVARDEKEATRLASGLVGHLDPRRVSVAPSHAACPEPVFAMLDDWIEESLVDDRRALDVLWLYQILASAPEGDLARWLEFGGSDSAREEVLERLSPEFALDGLSPGESCSARCRLTEAHECWTEQLGARRRAAEVWVEWAECLESEIATTSGLPRLVCDDLVEMVASVEDGIALQRLDGLVDRAARVESFIAWSHSAPFAEALVREFSQRLPEGRSFGNLQAATVEAIRLHVSPPGYAPGATLLEEESRALIAARVQAWVRRSTPARAWMPSELGPGAWKDVAGAHPLRGTGSKAHPVVVAAMLAKPGPLDRVLALLRLSAAASHSQGELACVDPRLGELFSGAWAVAPQAEILTDPASATEGRELLEKLPGRLIQHWRTPFDADRLGVVAVHLGAARAPTPPRQGELSEALAHHQRGEHLVLGGMLAEDRLALAWTTACMAEQSRDGGFLGARFVLWIGDEDPDLIEGAPFAVSVAGRGSNSGAELGAALENGRIRLLVIPTRLLDQDDWRDWIVGLERCLVLVAEGDRSVAGHLAHEPGLDRLLARLAAQKTVGRGVIVCADQADTRARGTLDSIAERIEGRALLVGKEAELASWRWQRVRLEDPSWLCSNCHREQTLAHAHALCERCGEALLQSEADRAAAKQALRGSQVRWLSRRGMEQEWLALAVDRAEREALLHDLGIVSQSDSAPLLGGSWSLDVVALEELWRDDPPDGELILTRLPDTPRQLRSVLSRLRSRGRLHGVLHFMDHPLAWDLPSGRPEATAPSPLPSLDQLRCPAARAEVEFRAREALGRVERALRARSAGGGRLRHGLGPVADPREDPRVASLAKAVEIWRSQASAGLAVDHIQQQGVRRIASLLDELEAAGFSFDYTFSRVSPLPEIYSDPADLEASQCVLRWMLSEGLLEEAEARAEGEASVLPEPAGSALLRWREAALSAPTGVATALPDWPATPSAAETEAAGKGIEVESGWILGVAGSGRTRALSQRLHAAGQDSPATLVILAGPADLLRWDQELRSKPARRVPVLCVTVGELVLDFLRCHHELGGFNRPPRVLAPAASPDGEDLRRRLLKETSRRYAVAAGTSPPVDLLEMRRVLEGQRVSAMAAAAGQSSELDAPLLERCAAEARRDGAWVLPSELGALSRRWLVEHPYVGEAWRDRYPQVLVDDYDAIPEDERAFLDRLFPEGFRLATADPSLLPVAHPRRGDGGARQSHRLPRELTRAGEILLREEILGRGTIRARSREKGKLLRQQVLNLEACARRIEEALSGQQWQRQRVGVVLGYSGDLPWLASRLREAEIPVWPARQVVPACSPGPRDLLLVLALAGRGPLLEPLVAGSLAGALLEIAGIESSSLDHERLGEWLTRLFTGEVGRANHPAEAFLAPLAAVAPRLAERESLADAAAILQGTHLLPRVLRNDALASRLASYVEERAEMPWRGVLSGLDPAGLVDPLAAGPRVWLLEPEEMVGLELDRAFYLCTGHEPAEVHYRVLGRVRESLTVLYSETDPYQPRR